VIKPQVFPVFLIVFASFCFTAMVTVPKFVDSTISVFLIAWIRFFSAGVILVPVVAVVRPQRSSNSPSWYFYSARCVLGISVLCLSVFAINNAPVFLVQIILMTNGVFTILLGNMFSVEKSKMSSFLPVMIIVLGGCLTTVDHSRSLATFVIQSDQLLGVLAAFIASIGWGAEVLITRSLAQRDHPLRIVTMVAWLSMLLVTPIMLFSNSNISLVEIILLSSMGLLAAAGQLSSATALAKISAAKATPYRYTSVLFGLLFSVIIFNEYPNSFQTFGSIIILITIIISSRQWNRTKP